MKVFYQNVNTEAEIAIFHPAKVHVLRRYVPLIISLN